MDEEQPKTGMSGSLSVVKAAAVLVLFAAAVALLVAVGTRPSVSVTPSTAPTTVPTTTPTTAAGAAGSSTTASTAASTTTTTRRGHRGAVTTTTTTAPSTVSVVVANGTSTNGLAAHYSTVIGAKGYMMKTPLDASATQTTSTVYYAAGMQAAAEAVAATIGVKPSQVQPLTTAIPVTGATGTDVVVVIGQDLASAANS
jgi:hypothetical protein